MLVDQRFILISSIAGFAQETKPVVSRHASANSLNLGFFHYDEEDLDED